jgi:hypothetical protein
MLAEEQGKQIFVMLGSCWLYEGEDEFKHAENFDPSITATEPLLDLGTFRGRSPPDVFFGSILPSSEDVGKPAWVALDHIGSYFTSTPPSLFYLEYHLRMVLTMNIALPYLSALTAHHSVRTVTRILLSLTADPYDEATAPNVARCIGTCLEYLDRTLPATDGFAWTTHAVQMGLLPAMLRSQAWLADMPDDEPQDALVGLLRLMSLLSMYPSLLRQLLRSIKRVRELNLPETIMDNPPFWTAFLELENLVTDRSALFGTDMNVRCNNPSVSGIANPAHSISDYYFSAAR